MKARRQGGDSLGRITSSCRISRTAQDPGTRLQARAGQSPRYASRSTDSTSPRAMEYPRPRPRLRRVSRLATVRSHDFRRRMAQYSGPSLITVPRPFDAGVRRIPALPSCTGQAPASIPESTSCSQPKLSGRIGNVRPALGRQIVRINVDLLPVMEQPAPVALQDVEHALAVRRDTRTYRDKATLAM